MTREQAIQERIDDIMDNFDFHKVRRHMESVNWTWMIDGESRVPEVPELRRDAREKLRACAYNRCGTFGGGFLVTYREGENTEDGKFFFLELFFVIESHTGDGVGYTE